MCISFLGIVGTMVSKILWRQLFCRNVTSTKSMTLHSLTTIVTFLLQLRQMIYGYGISKRWKNFSGLRYTLFLDHLPLVKNTIILWFQLEFWLRVNCFAYIVFHVLVSFWCILGVGVEDWTKDILYQFIKSQIDIDIPNLRCLNIDTSLL